MVLIGFRAPDRKVLHRECKASSGHQQLDALVVGGHQSAGGQNGLDNRRCQQGEDKRGISKTCFPPCFRDLLRPVRDATASNAPQLEIGQPRLWNARAIFVVCAYGLVLMLPVVISMLIVSTARFGVLTFLSPLLAIAIGAFFLPFGFGNPYVANLVRLIDPRAAEDQDAFIVQLSLVPRLRSGMRALIEDADDIGCLHFADSALVFRGDCISFSIPFEHIRAVQRRSSGWRGLFLYGAGSIFAASGLTGASQFHVAERSSWLLPASRRIARTLHTRLLEIQRPK
jgi:hypothetical protein